MEFDSKIHTKEFLIANRSIALDLAENSVEFLSSELTNDLDILRLANRKKVTVAHLLAKSPYLPRWIPSDTTNIHSILSLADEDGVTVAHCLTFSKHEWLLTDAAKKIDILKLPNANGSTVAHYLAFYQQAWLFSDEAKNHDVLSWTCNNGKSVAYQMVVSFCCKGIESHEALFHKKILTLRYEDKILAETITERYDSESYGMDVTAMAMKLITQGAAYKHSSPMVPNVGVYLLKQAKSILEDSLDPLVSLKQLKAFYSTFYHQIEQIETELKKMGVIDRKSLKKWEAMLISLEDLLDRHLYENPELINIDHTIDIFCEPSDELMRRLLSKYVLKSHTSLNLEIEPSASDMRSEKFLY